MYVFCILSRVESKDIYCRLRISYEIMLSEKKVNTCPTDSENVWNTIPKNITSNLAIFREQKNKKSDIKEILPSVSTGLVEAARGKGCILLFWQWQCWWWCGFQGKEGSCSFPMQYLLWGNSKHKCFVEIFHILSHNSDFLIIF